MPVLACTIRRRREGSGQVGRRRRVSHAWLPATTQLVLPRTVRQVSVPGTENIVLSSRWGAPRRRRASATFLRMPARSMRRPLYPVRRGWWSAPARKQRRCAVAASHDTRYLRGGRDARAPCRSNLSAGCFPGTG